MKNQVKPNSGSNISKKIRDKGFTVAGWARVKGFPRTSVYAVISGDKLKGNQGDKIKKALARDGFLDSTTQVT